MQIMLHSRQASKEHHGLQCSIVRSFSCSRVTYRSVAEEYSIWVELHDLVCGVVCWHNNDLTPKAGKTAQDVVLDTKVIRHNLCAEGTAAAGTGLQHAYDRKDGHSGCKTEDEVTQSAEDACLQGGPKPTSSLP